MEIQTIDLLPFHDEYPLHDIEDIENMFDNTEEEIVFKENESTEQPAYDTHKSPSNIQNLNTNTNEEDNITVEEDTEDDSIKK